MLPDWGFLKRIRYPIKTKNPQELLPHPASVQDVGPSWMVCAGPHTLETSQPSPSQLGVQPILPTLLSQPRSCCSSSCPQLGKAEPPGLCGSPG